MVPGARETFTAVLGEDEKKIPAKKAALVAPPSKLKPPPPIKVTALPPKEEKTPEKNLEPLPDAAKLPVPQDVKLKAPSEFKLLGTSAKRIDTPGKQWKFSTADLAVRAKWDAYQAAYQSALSATSTDIAPWSLRRIPALTRPSRVAMRRRGN